MYFLKGPTCGLSFLIYRQFFLFYYFEHNMIHKKWRKYINERKNSLFSISPLYVRRILYIIKKVANIDDELYSTNFTIIDDILIFVNYLNIFQGRKFTIVVTVKSLIWHFHITIKFDKFNLCKNPNSGFYRKNVMYVQWHWGTSAGPIKNSFDLNPQYRFLEEPMVFLLALKWKL